MGKKEPIPALRRHIGKRVRELREQQRMTREDMAGSTLSVNAIVRIENGERSPTLETLTRIAEALGVRVEDLVRDAPVRQVDQSPGVRRVERALRGRPAHVVEGVADLVDSFLRYVDGKSKARTRTRRGS